MPWVHFHIGDDGMAKACCVANIPFGNINSQSFEEIWSSNSINELRSKFNKGEKDKRCANCYKLEESGATSIRQETWERFKDVKIDFKEPSPIYFDIRFSNVCNLKCRTCWHGASSSWFEDAKILGTNKGEKAIIQNIFDFQDFIKKTGRQLKNAKEFYFAGGEPLIMEEHYLLLQWLIKNNITKVKLRYNTNFTRLKYKGESILDLWQKFETVEIMASLDAPNDHAAYIRPNTQWNEIIDNFNKASQYSHLQFTVAPTISVLNIAQLPYLIETCINETSLTENDVYINLLERPIHFNIQIFPIALKQTITEKLIHFQLKIQSQKLKSQLNEIVQYMNAKDQSKHWNKFISKNQELDKLRSTSPIFDYYNFH